MSADDLRDSRLSTAMKNMTPPTSPTTLQYKRGLSMHIQKALEEYDRDKNGMLDVNEVRDCPERRKNGDKKICFVF